MASLGPKDGVRNSYGSAEAIGGMINSLYKFSKVRVNETMCRVLSDIHLRASRSSQGYIRQAGELLGFFLGAEQLLLLVPEPEGLCLLRVGFGCFETDKARPADGALLAAARELAAGLAQSEARFARRAEVALFLEPFGAEAPGPEAGFLALRRDVRLSGGAGTQLVALFALPREEGPAVLDHSPWAV